MQSIAASTLLNTLLSEIQSSPSLTLFRQQLKTYLRNHSLMSYSDDYVSVDLAITFVILDTLNIFSD